MVMLQGQNDNRTLILKSTILLILNEPQDFSLNVKIGTYKQFRTQGQ
jgi:hypothetical protein